MSRARKFIKNECGGNMTTSKNMYKASTLKNVIINQNANRCVKQKRMQI